MDETRRTDIHQRLLDRYGARGEALYMLVAGLLATQLTGNHVYDGAAPIGIGAILVFVAFELGRDSRDLLLGESALPEDRERARELVVSFPE